MNVGNNVGDIYTKTKYLTFLVKKFNEEKKKK